LDLETAFALLGLAHFVFAFGATPILLAFFGTLAGAAKTESWICLPQQLVEGQRWATAIPLNQSDKQMQEGRMNDGIVC
jgi:hypothetical protein